MNPQAFASLAAAQPATDIWASLTPLDPAIAPVPFLYNPESKDFSRSPNWASAETGGDPNPAANYVGGGAKTLKLSGLILESFAHQKSLRSLLDAFERLTIPTAPGLAPPAVNFVWGTEIFGPAFVSDLAWTETAWLGGEPATATLGFTLTQIPSNLTPAAPPAAPTGEVALSERQQVEGANKGIQALTAEANTLPPLIRSAFVSGRYDVVADATGEVSLKDSAGELLGIIGRWDGFNFESLIGTLSNV